MDPKEGNGLILIAPTTKFSKKIVMVMCDKGTNELYLLSTRKIEDEPCSVTAVKGLKDVMSEINIEDSLFAHSKDGTSLVEVKLAFNSIRDFVKVRGLFLPISSDLFPSMCTGHRAILQESKILG